MRKPIILLSALCALLAIPAAAGGQENAAQDEYTEQVPGGSGDRPSNNPGGGTPLPADAAEGLQALGSDGAAAAALAETTGPGRDGKRQIGPGRGSNSDATAATSDDEAGNGGGGGFAGAVEAIVDGPEEDGGIGVGLPLILGASLIAAVGFLLARRRGGTPAGPA